MHYETFCRTMGISPSPALEARYQQAEAEGELVRLPPVDRLDAYFPTYHGQVAAAARQIAADPAALRYYNLLRLGYFSSAGPFLSPKEGDLVRNFAPALVLAAHWPEAQRRMEERGIGETDGARIRAKLGSFLADHEESFGYPAVSEMLFYWSVHYLRPDLYPIGSLEFEVTTMAPGETVFRHRVTGEAVWLLDPEETTTAYSGTTYRRGGKAADPVTLLKEEYVLWVAPGDDILSVHIPKGADVSAASCAQTYRQAAAFFNKYYPERHFKGWYCRSWLMDPALTEALPSGSRIASFQQFYSRYPYPSDGNEVFVFVHPTPFADYNELPENTSLERMLKQRYLNGDPIYRYAGLHEMEVD